MKRIKRPHGYYRKRKEHSKKLSRLIKKRIIAITGHGMLVSRKVMEEIPPIIIEPPVFEDPRIIRR